MSSLMSVTHDSGEDGSSFVAVSLIFRAGGVSKSVIMWQRDERVNPGRNCLLLSAVGIKKGLTMSRQEGVGISEYANDSL